VTGRPDHVLIRRTGLPALRLDGYGLCASATSRTPQGPTQTRWHELELWSADERLQGPEQRHCLVVRYCTQWQGELGHDHAELVLRRRVGDALREHDPLAHLVGYPDGEHYARKQEMLECALRSGYEHAVTELLEAARVWEIGDP
jgi:hypothetical protein